jgi:hypothetical protein
VLIEVIDAARQLLLLAFDATKLARKLLNAIEQNVQHPAVNVDILKRLSPRWQMVPGGIGHR